MKIIKYFSLFIILCLLLVGASFASNDTTTISNEKITTLDNTHVVSNNTCISTKDNKIQKTNEYNKIDKIKVNNTKKSDKTYDKTNTTKSIKKTSSNLNSTYDYYVNPINGNDSNNGNSSNPYKSLNKAITTAKMGNSIYLYDGNHKLDKVLPTLNKSLKIYGQSKNNTIIDGDYKYTVFIVYKSNLTLENLKIINGNGTYGGAIKGKANSTIFINNCYFQNNRGVNGGAIGSIEDNCNIEILNSTFNNNSASNNGGSVISSALNSNLKISNSTFINNRINNIEGKGGALYIGGSTTSSISAKFVDNLALDGGAIYVARLSKSNITNSIFINNKAGNENKQGDGGAINIGAGDHQIKTSIFMNNSATNGGAVSVHSGRPVYISNSTFDKNMAFKCGGAVFNYGDGSVTNCNFTNNLAKDRGGAFIDTGRQDTYNIIHCRFSLNRAYNNTNSSWGGAVALCGGSGRYKISKSYFERNSANCGGGIVIVPASVICDIEGSSFHKNNATYDGGVLFSRGNTSTVNIKYSNFTTNSANNSGALLFDGLGSSYVIDYCFFRNNYANSSGGAIQNQKNSSISSKYTKFIENKALTKGGAIYNNDLSNLYLSTMNFVNNTANSGSAIYNCNSNNSFINKSCIINNNIVSHGSFDARFNWWGSNNGNTSVANVDKTFPVVFVSSVKTVTYDQQNNITSFKVLLDVYHYNDTGVLRILDQNMPNMTVNLNNNLKNCTFDKQQYILFSLIGNQKNSSNVLTAKLDYQTNNMGVFKYNYINLPKIIIAHHGNNTINATICQIDDTLLDCDTQIVLKLNDNTYQIVDLLGKSGNSPVTRAKIVNGKIKINFTIPSTFLCKNYSLSLVNIGHEVNTSLLCERSISSSTLTLVPNNEVNAIETNEIITEPKKQVIDNITELDLGLIESNNFIKDDNIKSLKQSENTNNLTKVRVVAGDITTHPGNNVNISGYVVDEHNKTVSTGKLFIKINGDTYTSCIIKDNKFNCTYRIPNLNAGIYKLQYVYLQNSKYARSELNKTLNITNNLFNVRVVANSITVHPGDNVTFNGYVVDEFNKTVPVGKLFIKINGKTYTSCIIEDNKFNCTYRIPNLKTGVYKLQYVYLQNSKYARYELNKTLNITNNLFNVRVVANSVSAYPGDNVTFNGYVVDEYNRIVSTGKLFIKINGNTYTSCIIEDNKFNCTYSIPNWNKGVYKLQYVYLQNSKYARYELNKTLNLPNKLVNVKIVAGNIAAHPGDKVNVNGYVLDEHNKVVPYGKIVIKLNGKTHLISNITNNKINYTYTIPNYEAKKYNLQYVYVANDKYDRYELNKTLIINNDEKMKSTTILVDDFETYNGGLLTMTGKVVDSNQKLVNGGNILYKLNGNTVEFVPVINGTFEFKKVIHNMGLKNYELTFAYGLIGLYDRSEANRILSITNKEDPLTKVIINASDITCYAGGGVSVKGTVKDEFGHPLNSGSIIIKINGKTVMGWDAPLSCPIVNGKFENSFVIPNYSVKDYKLQYIHVQDDKYARYELNKTLTIKKQQSVISFIPYDQYHPYFDPSFEFVGPGEVLYLAVSVNGLVTGNIASSGNISLKVNDKLYQINNKTLTAPIKDNKAIFKYTIPKNAKPGSLFKLTLLYSGSSNFYESELSATVEVI